ncbi:hypothetical protein B9X62_20070 [Acinetobacter pittii]|uniref:hypothetical protein n=1 Tax=Acinetobacter TaxID=469 RepID=UPI0008B92FAC|nr:MULTISPECIES: hypothetical protein [Acinetobacter]OTL80100.1 hypothetical protein B9X62_20070 [Acinetobacter pittii]SEO55939.1 hypothetical protein SAMN04487817_106169 [Acinetobacter sp. yr461]
MTEKTTKQVRATQKGYYNDRLIEEGQVFSVPEDETALWFEDVEPKQADSTKAYSSMTPEELANVAAEKGISLSGSESKAQIIKLLKAE